MLVSFAVVEPAGGMILGHGRQHLLSPELQVAVPFDGHDGPIEADQQQVGILPAWNNGSHLAVKGHPGQLVGVIVVSQDSPVVDVHEVEDVLAAVPGGALCVVYGRGDLLDGGSTEVGPGRKVPEYVIKNTSELSTVFYY